jgi:DNA-binding response OmpR family regulator
MVTRVKKILVADDDVSIANLLTQALTDEGYETYKAVQSLRFYDAVRDHKPDLILLDLMMPYLEGDDELQLLQLDSQTAHIPVIIVTAKTEAKREEARYRQWGVVAIVTKPFDIEQLVQLIKRTIGD